MVQLLNNCYQNHCWATDLRMKSKKCFYISDLFKRFLMASLEHLISEARLLGNRLRENESFADTLISQSSNIQERLTAMKEVHFSY